MKHTRTILSLCCGVTLLASASLLQAAEEPVIEVSEKERLRHETTGIFGGAVIGGLIGGPAGAILAAGFGGWVSEHTIASKERTLLSTALEARQQELVALEAEYRALEARYQVAARETESARLRNVSFEAGSRNDRLAACCTDTELSLHFKSGSADIESLYDAKLAEFAALVKELPEAVIEITGHADRRGDSAANLALSQQRIQAVEKKLQSLGVRKVSLQTSAFGENRPLSQTDTLENNFFDRRVVLKLVSAGNGYLTRADD